MDITNPPLDLASGSPPLSDFKSFGPRAGAYIIDSIIYTAITFVLSLVVGAVAGLLVFTMNGRPPIIDQDGLNVGSFVIGLINSALYFTLFEWLAAASPGKMILGMRVVRTDGTPVGPGGALLRGILRYVDSLFFAIPAIMSMNRSPEQQRIGDKAANTTVVGAQDPGLKDMPPLMWGLAAIAAYVVIAGILTLLMSLIYIK